MGRPRPIQQQLPAWPHANPQTTSPQHTHHPACHLNKDVFVLLATHTKPTPVGPGPALLPIRTVQQEKCQDTTPSKQCSIRPHPGRKCLGVGRDFRPKKDLSGSAAASPPASSIPLPSPLRHLRVLSAALHQAQQPALHALPTCQGSLHGLHLGSRNSKQRWDPGRASSNRGGPGKGRKASKTAVQRI